MGHGVRRGGQFLLGEEQTIWSVATGSRGRRWRWVISDPAGLTVTHTLETDPDGRFVKLESATPSGLLTLHREGGGSVQGNHVDGAGIQHVAMEGAASGLALVGWSPIAVAALIGGIGSLAEAAHLDVLWVADALGTNIERVAVRPVDRSTIDVELRGQTQTVKLDGDGLPIVRGGESWPLELG